MNPVRNPMPTASGGKISNGVNLATRLSISRIILSFVFMICLLSQALIFRILALFFFILAALTDIYDGRIARSTNTVTSLGILLDPLADKILISAAFISFVGMKEVWIPAWMVVIIISREFLVIGLRLLAAGKRKILPAEKQGKRKAISQMGTIIIILLYLIVKGIAQHRGLWSEAMEMAGRFGIYIVMSFTLILTIASGYSYLSKNKNIFLE